MNKPSDNISVQILVSTIRVEGLRRLAKSSLPLAPWLSYLVGCQRGGDSPESIGREFERLFGNRCDVSLKIYDTIGLSVSRNSLKSETTGDVMIFIDDDVALDAGALAYVRDYFASHGEVDVVKTRIRINGRFIGGDKPRCVRRNRWRGEYAVANALAMRRNSLDGLAFCPCLGVGAARYMSGEDDIFFTQVLEKGLKVEYLPVEMAVHNGQSTAERFHSPGVLLARGLVLAYVHPHTWPVHAALLAARVEGSGWWRNFRTIARGASELKDIAELRRR